MLLLIFSYFSLLFPSSRSHQAKSPLKKFSLSNGKGRKRKKLASQPAASLVTSQRSRLTGICKRLSSPRSRANMRCWSRTWCRSRRGSRCRSRARCRCRTRLRAVAAAGAGITIWIKYASPDDHFIASPNCSVRESAIGSADRVGIVSSTRVEVISKVVARLPSPDNHLAAGPHRRVIASAIWHVGDGSRCPAIGGRVVPSASIQVVIKNVREIPSPNDHFPASPHRLVTRSASRRIDGARNDPVVGTGIVSAAAGGTVLQKPQLTFARSRPTRGR